MHNDIEFFQEVAGEDDKDHRIDLGSSLTVQVFCNSNSAHPLCRSITRTSHSSHSKSSCAVPQCFRSCLLSCTITLLSCRILLESPHLPPMFVNMQERDRGMPYIMVERDRLILLAPISNRRCFTSFPGGAFIPSSRSLLRLTTKWSEERHRIGSAVSAEIVRTNKLKLAHSYIRFGFLF